MREITPISDVRDPIETASLWERGFVVAALFLFTGAIVPLLRRAQGGAAGAPDPSQGDPLMQPVWFLIYITSFALLLRHRVRLMRLVARTAWLWALVGLALLSVLESAAPQLTLRRGAALVGTTLFGAYFGARYDVKEQLRLLAFALGVTVVLSVTFALAFPSLGMADGAWRGVFIHKNVLGRLMALATIVAVLLSSASERRRMLPWVGAAAALLLVVLSTSKTALVLTLLMLVVWVLRSAVRWRYPVLVPFILTMLALGTLGSIVLVDNWYAILASLDRDPTLTGRVELWEVVAGMIAQQPWLGYGYSGFWLEWKGPSAFVWLVTGWSPPHAHNGLLDLWLDLGLAGVILFTIGFLQAYARAVRIGRIGHNAEGYWPFLYLTLLAFYNVTESTILTRNGIFWVLYTAVFVSLAERSLEPHGVLDPRQATGSDLSSRTSMAPSL